jgi:hypothetical protein
MWLSSSEAIAQVYYHNLIFIELIIREKIHILQRVKGSCWPFNEGMAL